MSDNLLDRYLSEPIRAQFEQAYYECVNAQAQLERLVHDPVFWQNPSKHPALFSDHGVVHVRDVAQQLLAALETINGVLIPRREQDRMDGFMQGYGVMLAYLHDIGMVDFSPFGRVMHPEYAAQAVFGAELAELIDQMWAENSGHVAERLPGWRIGLFYSVIPKSSFASC